RILRKMQADPLGTVFRLKITTDGVGDHGVQFRERISLSSDTAAPLRLIPARHVTTSLRARLDTKGDFVHGKKLTLTKINVNSHTNIAPSVSAPLPSVPAWSWHIRVLRWGNGGKSGSRAGNRQGAGRCRESPRAALLRRSISARNS